jgi:hypothetical protein
MPFQAGNKAGGGRRRGSLNKRTVWQRALIKGEKSIVDAVVKSAQEGQGAAQVLCAKFLGPTIRRREPIDLPSVSSPADILEALKRIAAYQAEGVIDDREAMSLTSTFSAMLTALREVEFGDRLAAVEEKLRAQS